MKSTRRQDYVSKRDIFNSFINRAEVRDYKRKIAKDYKRQQEILADRKAEEANKAEPITGEVIE